MDGRDVHRDRVKIRWFVHMLEFEVFTYGIYMYLLLNSCTCSQIIVKLPRRSIEKNSYEDECILTSVKALKWNESESCSVVTDSLRPHGLYRPWNYPGQNTGVGSCSLLQGIFPTQGSNPGLPHSNRQNSLPAESQGKPKNTGVGSQSLLQRIFLTQGSNPGLLNYRKILYYLSQL